MLSPGQISGLFPGAHFLVHQGRAWGLSWEGVPGSGKALVLLTQEELLEGLKAHSPSALSALAQVRESAQAFNPGLLCVACGSYRRGKATCGDVDVLLTHPDGRSHQGIFSRLLDSLRQQGISSISG